MSVYKDPISGEIIKTLDGKIAGCGEDCCECLACWDGTGANPCCRYMTFTLGNAGHCNTTHTFTFPNDAAGYLVFALCGAYGPDGEIGWLIAFDVSESLLCDGGKGGYWEAFIPLVRDSRGNCCPEIGPINWVCTASSHASDCDGMTLTGEMFGGALEWEASVCELCAYCETLTEEELAADVECQGIFAARDACIEDPCGAGCSDLRDVAACDIPPCVPPVTCDDCQTDPDQPGCEGFQALLDACGADPCSEACVTLNETWGCDSLPAPGECP